jgi:hypothetical protein
MAHRALIIAIENYPDMADRHQATLPGTLQAGLDFKDWLVGKWSALADAQGHPVETEFLFCSEPVVASMPGLPGQPPIAGRPAARKDIVKAVRDLRDRGANATEELFVFFSGHGFSFASAGRAKTHFLLSSDFETPELSAPACLPLLELINWLRDHMGPGRHFYFIDACRNLLTEATVVPPNQLLPIDPNAPGGGRAYYLQSARTGVTAPADSAFVPALLRGLAGGGRAKQYVPDLDDAMVVHYGSLKEYLTRALKDHRPSGDGDEDENPADALLATIKPVPTATCTVRVEDALAGDEAFLRIQRGRGAVEEIPFTPPSVQRELPADDYRIGVRIKDASVDPPELQKFDGFEGAPAVLTFRRSEGLSMGGGLGVTPLEMNLPAGARGLPAGEGPPRLGSARAAWDLSLPHRSIAALLPHDDQGVDFSESLGGAVTDPDLDLWLAILGGGRVLASHKTDYQKIGPLPLCDFTAESAGASPLYLLAAFPEDRPLELSVSDGVAPHWQAVEPIAEMPGLRHLRVGGSAGPKLVSIRLPDAVSWTYASLTMPNRVTLLTLTLDEDGDARVSQYLLPIGHLVSHLPGDLPAYVGGRPTPLDDVRNLAAAGRAFRRRGDMGRHMPQHLFQELVGAKWVDPIGSAFVAYQALRRGDKALVRQVATNMLTFFPDLPDSAALAIRAGTAMPRPPGVPLIRDGLGAYPDFAEWLPLPAGLLDGTGPWTAWRGAV